MAFSINSKIMEHVSEVNTTLTFDKFNKRQLSMFNNYIKNGVMRTYGMPGRMARIVRSMNGLQSVVVTNSKVKCHKIKDEAVYDAVLAALTLCKIDGDKSTNRWSRGNAPYVYVITDDEYRDIRDVAYLTKNRPSNFVVYLDKLDHHFSLSKLSDSMTFDTSKPFVVDMLKHRDF